MILPENGRIVVIDDKDEEGKPLVNALTQAGHLATFFTPEPEHLPENPLTGIRVVFLDLKLQTEYQPTSTMISTILNVMDKIVHKQDNGPFFLVSWTNRPEEAEKVENALRRHGFMIVTARMEKQNCKKNGKMSMSLIRNGIDAALTDGAVLQMFTLWENCVHRAAGKIVRRFSSLCKPDDQWNERMELVIAKLAKSVLGKHFKPEQTKEAVESSMYSLNAALIDAIRQETRNSSESSGINMCLPNPSDKKPASLMDGEINHMLLLKTVTGQSPMPGNIYKNMLEHVNLEKLVNNPPNLPKILDRVEHIMLEVTPVCDFAEQKLLRNRILPGVIFPNEYYDKLKGRAEFLTISPVLANQDYGLFNLVFDFRLFTSIDMKEMSRYKPMFAIQNDLLADIQTKLAKHVSRLGVSSV